MAESESPSSHEVLKTVYCFHQYVRCAIHERALDGKPIHSGMYPDGEIKA